MPHPHLTFRFVIQYLVVTGAILLLAAAGYAAAREGRRLWRESQRTDLAYATDKHTVEIAATRSVPAQTAHFLAAPGEAPLIVDLHPWASNLGAPSGDDGPRLDELAYRHGWHYIRPTLTGPNNTPAACCSMRVIDAIDAAIAYARSHTRVSRVLVIGGSGGGYTALCAALSGRLADVAAYQAWVPVTDLAAWYAQRPGLGYERDIRACTGSGTALNVAEARRRSPLYLPLPATHAPIHLFAGVHDSSGGSMPGSVPITHAIRMYDRLAVSPINDAVVLGLLEHRSGPQTGQNRRLQGRRVHLFAQAPSVDLVVFEGGHELLGSAALAIAERDARAKPR